MPEDRGRCLAAGMDEYVAKPFRQGSLFEAIAIAIGIEPEETSADADASSADLLNSECRPGW
jgi:CheY-like chemotaxis protein